jgi:hypothetical protein
MSARQFLVSVLLGTLCVSSALAQEPKKLDDPHFDKAIYDGIAAITNLESADTMAFFVYMDEPENGLGGVPSAMVARKEIAQRSLDAINLMTSADPRRERLRRSLIQYFETILPVNDKIAEGFKMSNAKKSWTDEAKQVISAANKMLQDAGRFDIMQRVRKSIFENQDQLNRCPDELQRLFGLADDSTGFSLGVAGYTDDSDRTFTFVMKGLLAAHMGFHSGDTLKNFNGKPVKNLIDFKKNLLTQSGKKIDATVIRDGKELSVILDIPIEIKRFDDDQTATGKAKTLLESILEGKVDRKALTAEFNKGFSEEKLKTARDQLLALGRIESFKFRSTELTGDPTVRSYLFQMGKTKLLWIVAVTKDGLVDQITIGPGS